MELPEVSVVSARVSYRSLQERIPRSSILSVPRVTDDDVQFTSSQSCDNANFISGPSGKFVWNLSGSTLTVQPFNLENSLELTYSLQIQFPSTISANCIQAGYNESEDKVWFHLISRARILYILTFSSNAFYSGNVDSNWCKIGQSLSLLAGIPVSLYSPTAHLFFIGFHNGKVAKLDLNHVLNGGGFISTDIRTMPNLDTDPSIEIDSKMFNDSTLLETLTTWISKSQIIEPSAIISMIYLTEWDILLCCSLDGCLKAWCCSGSSKLLFKHSLSQTVNVKNNSNKSYDLQNLVISQSSLLLLSTSLIAQNLPNQQIQICAKPPLSTTNLCLLTLTKANDNSLTLINKIWIPLQQPENNFSWSLSAFCRDSHNEYLYLLWRSDSFVEVHRAAINPSLTFNWEVLNMLDPAILDEPTLMSSSADLILKQILFDLDVDSKIVESALLKLAQIYGFNVDMKSFKCQEICEKAVSTITSIVQTQNAQVNETQIIENELWARFFKICQRLHLEHNEHVALSLMADTSKDIPVVFCKNSLLILDANRQLFFSEEINDSSSQNDSTDLYIGLLEYANDLCSSDLQDAIIEFEKRLDIEMQLPPNYSLRDIMITIYEGCCKDNALTEYLSDAFQQLEVDYGSSWINKAKLAVDQIHEQMQTAFISCQKPSDTALALFGQFLKSYCRLSQHALLVIILIINCQWVKNPRSAEDSLYLEHFNYFLKLYLQHKYLYYYGLSPHLNWKMKKHLLEVIFSGEHSINGISLNKMIFDLASTPIDQMNIKTKLDFRIASALVQLNYVIRDNINFRGLGLQYLPQTNLGYFLSGLLGFLGLEIEEGYFILAGTTTKLEAFQKRALLALITKHYSHNTEASKFYYEILKLLTDRTSNISSAPRRLVELGHKWSMICSTSEKQAIEELIFKNSLLVHDFETAYLSCTQIEDKSMQAKMIQDLTIAGTLSSYDFMDQFIRFSFPGMQHIIDETLESYAMKFQWNKPCLEALSCRPDYTKLLYLWRLFRGDKREAASVKYKHLCMLKSMSNESESYLSLDDDNDSFSIREAYLTIITLLRSTDNPDDAWFRIKESNSQLMKLVKLEDIQTEYRQELERIAQKITLM